ncbi:MAG TPA: 5-methylcytosine-specific restriction endonuclease system specificity protein McrC [Paludibacter sp.]|nr:5-methylcytosine-specific restriction endonuclease system specificity protein McrC [Paludibacter sp.]HPM10613.1 5-methylcytosine-specific restriction endonuclease system specificity protein McrC [Paludibacter sp.]
MHIPIENIYYLLCYAWNKLDAKDRISVAVDDKTELLDLFAKILINATKILLKRGVDRNYVNYTSEIPGIKGKLELSQTIKRNLHLKQRTICSYDEFSANVPINEILVTTLHRLIKTRDLNRDLKDEIKRILWMFTDIDQIEIRSSLLKTIRLNRNNRFYGIILDVCQMIHENSKLPTEQSGMWKFVDFTRDEWKMSQLFEAFVRNFYKVELSDYYVVKREDIRWQFSSSSTENFQFLPKMETDITLESKNKTSKIIIDTKYYRETMVTNYDKERIHSTNLYQLFSYLMNQQDNNNPVTLQAAGILLYPTIDKDLDLHYKYDDHNIYIKTVNLNAHWKKIEERLKQIIGIDAKHNN